MFDMVAPIEGKLSDGPKCFGCRGGTRYAVLTVNPGDGKTALTYHICPTCDWPPGGKTNGKVALEAYYENKRD